MGSFFAVMLISGALSGGACFAFEALLYPNKPVKDLISVGAWGAMLGSAMASACALPFLC